MSNDNKFNVFDALPKINQRDYTYLESLDVEQVKQFAPLVVMKWLTCCDDPGQIVSVNENVNSHLFVLQHHKHLLFKLMCASAETRRMRYNWIKPTGSNKKTKKSSISQTILKSIYNYSDREAQSMIPNISGDVLLKLADQLGYDKKQITDLKKELRGMDK